MDGGELGRDRERGVDVGHVAPRQFQTYFKASRGGFSPQRRRRGKNVDAYNAETGVALMTVQ